MAIDIPILPSPEMRPVTMLDSSCSDSDRPTTRLSKRKRSMPTMPITPPATYDDPHSLESLNLGLRVLNAEATALALVARHYESDAVAKAGLLKYIETMVRVNEARGKLHICGVGKSAIIGEKIVASMKSLSIPCSYLHATEAMHGDLGDVKEYDAVLFITFSGKTQELLLVDQQLRGLHKDIPVMALTSHVNMDTCVLLAGRPDAILLPAPVHETEEITFGYSAPTTSTTVAGTVGNMLAQTVAARIHGSNVANIFRRNHPGGAIGMAR